MEKTLNIGFLVKTIINTITLSCLNEPNGEKFYEAKKKQVQRMYNYDIQEMTESDKEKFFNFMRELESWYEWAKHKGYLKIFQQNAIGDFCYIMFEAAQYDTP